MSELIDLGCFLIGLLAGSLHFLLLRWNTRLFLTAGLPLAFAAQAGRLALLAAVMIGVARLGAVPLLLAAAGVALARPIAVRRMAPAP